MAGLKAESSAKLPNNIVNEAGPFERNAERVRYPKFRAQGLFAGSGVLQAGCKTAIGAHLKTLRNVLDGPRRQRHPRPALLPPRFMSRTRAGRAALPEARRTLRPGH